MNQTTEPGRDLAVSDFSSAVATQQSRAVMLPQNLEQAMQLAHFMAGGIGVRQWMRGNPSACLALIQISMRWGMDPYIVSNKAYYANDTLSFEAQLVNAVLNTCGELIGRLKVEFTGDATGGKGKETLVCTVSGRIKADPDQLFVHEQALAPIAVRNSPLWTVNPRQQLQYYTTRAWARLYLPEVLLGIYTPDEIADGVAERIERESTPVSAEPAPDRRSFENAENEAEDADFTPIETVVVESTDEQAENADERPESTAESPDSAPNDPESGPETASETVSEGEKLPSTKDEWKAWKKATRADLDAVTTREQFDRLRQRIDPALNAADDTLLDQIQDALADKLATLPEKSS